MHYHLLEFLVHERQQIFLDEAAQYRLQKESLAASRHQDWPVLRLAHWINAHLVRWWNAWKERCDNRRAVGDGNTVIKSKEGK